MPKVAQKDLDQFGLAVKRARVGKGWTLDQLAGSLTPPSSKSFLSNVEKGQRPISALTVSKLVAALDLPTSWIDRFLNSDVAAETEETPQDLNAERLIGMVTQPSDFHPAEALLIALAYEFAGGKFLDLSTAYTGLRNALQTAAEMRAELDRLHNLDDRLAAILRRVSDLNDQGLRDDAGEALDEEIKRNDAEAEALFNAALKQDRIRNCPADAAKRLIKRLLVDNPPDPFKALCTIQEQWRVNGQNRGLPFDSTVAILLAENALDRANNDVQRFVALMQLAEAQQTLGYMVNDAHCFEAAIKIYRRILRELVHNQKNLNWVFTQMHLGRALSTLGELEGDIARLEEAIVAHELALPAIPRFAYPKVWAEAQMHYGNALQSVGKRDMDTARLYLAVDAFRNALEEQCRSSERLDEAKTQMNLGTALWAIGEKEFSAERLNEAICAFKKAVSASNRKLAPLYWARAQQNLGNVWRALGALTSRKSDLKKAIFALDQALLEFSPEFYPLEWANTQLNSSAAKAALGRLEKGTTNLNEAAEACEAALTIYDSTNTPIKWGMVQANLASIATAYFDKTANPSHLATARSYALAAREVFANAHAEHYVQKADGQLAQIAARTP